MISAEQIKESYLALKTQVEFLFSKEKKVQKYLDATLEDGTNVQVEGDMPMIGAAVLVVAADGSTAPIPDGEYLIAEHQVMVVGGLITEMEMKMKDAVPPVVEAPADAKNKDEQKMEANKYDKAMEEMNARITKMEELLKSTQKMATDATATATEGRKLIVELQNANKDLKKFAEQSFKLVELLANEPSNTPLQKPVKTEVESLNAMQKFRKEHGLI